MSEAKKFCGIDINEARNDWKKIEELKSKYTKHIENLPNQSKKYKNFGHELEWNDFVRMNKACFSPQSYGGRIQNRHILKIGAKKVSSKLNKGDFSENQKNNKEYKVSLTTEINSNINIVQIRDISDVDYRITAVDLRDWDNPKTYTFDLTHEQMKKELEIMKATSAHGTKDAIKNNKSVEKRMSIGIDGADFKRWCDKYIVSNDGKY